MFLSGHLFVAVRIIAFRNIPFFMFGIVELTSRYRVKLPDKMDVDHAARGLVQIWTTYRYKKYDVRLYLTLVYRKSMPY